MTFDDWWADQDPFYRGDDITARAAWRAACTAAAGMVAETAFGFDTDKVVEAIIELRG